jgi:hypothetical protein
VTESTTPTLEAILANVSDNSRIEDEAGFAACLDQYEKDAKRAVSAWQSSTNAAKAAALSRVETRMFIRLSGGMPDWAAKSDAYRLTVSDVEARAFAKLDPNSKSRLQAAIRQHVMRTYNLRGVVSYVVAKEPHFEAEAAKLPNGIRSSEEAFADVIGNATDKLRKACRAHFEAAKLTVPADIADTVPVSNTAGPEAGAPESPVETLSTALDGLAQIVPNVSLPAIRDALVVVCKSLSETTGAVDERPAVMSVLRDIAHLATLTADKLDGNDTAAKELAKLVK